ncbi:malonyl-[acyl-carrier protein] O-methyltransferase BioC, partial [Pseudomonas aeruginosa]
LQHAAGSGLLPLTQRHQDRLQHLPHQPSQTHEQKALGAHNHNPRRPDGLTGPQRNPARVAAYERFPPPQGLPPTNRLVLGVLRNDYRT